MPRTSSIDSAISNISVPPLNPQIRPQDSPSNLPDISNLINAAGSPEAAIQHLLKEKQHAAAQNAQLWKLVDKQRSLVLGLNKDLERATEDKDRYRKKLKEALDKQALTPNTLPQPSPMPARAPTPLSPARSDASADLPIQRQSVESIIPEATVKPLTLRGPRNLPPLNQPSEAEVSTTSPVKAHPGTKHGHKQTSSSDVNIFTAYSPTNNVKNDTPETPRQVGDELDSQTSPINRPTMSPTNSFTAKRSQTHSSKPVNGSDPISAEKPPPLPDGDTMTPPRKPPPAPLDLGPAKGEGKASQYGPEDHSESEYEDSVDADELPSFERGRKKTREDDDREREAALLREKATQSHSKKSKSSNSRSASAKKNEEIVQQAQAVPMPPAIKALAPQATPLGQTFLSPPMSLAGALNPQETQKGSEITTRTLPVMPLSPGLPLSPRPVDRPQNPPTPRLPRDGTGPSVASPPLSPRPGIVGLPLSPRAPRQAIPLPHTPMSMAPISPMPASDARQDSSSSGQASTSSGRKDSSVSDHQEVASINSTMAPPKGVFRGFISEAYPNLLIPPNALPSIKVKVVSSRLKPSRHSIVLKGADEEPVFTLGVSARYDRQDLWQVEKALFSLQQLDHQLRQSPGFSVKVPDRSLFSGHAPAKVDARRVALENYFEAVLDTQLNERAAVCLCTYLSTNVSEPAAKEAAAQVSTYANSINSVGSDRKLRKEGFLTKRGKNFGGWKARYFVLDKAVLEYYESAGGKGGPLGQIKLHHASIGKQSPKAQTSPSRTEDSDGEYRHAFLIREPKRKDSTSFVDHVLCAESDAERDAWVEALLCYVEGSGSEHDTRPKPPVSMNSGSSKSIAPVKKNSIKNDVGLSDSPESENFDSLQAVPYEETRQAQAPHVSVTRDPKAQEMPSPTLTATQQPLRTPSSQSRLISGPTNGVKISDVGAWGNKPMLTPIANPKEQKKSRLWSFRDNKSDHLGIQPNGANLSLTQQQQEYQEHATNVKAVFGAPLVDAVEYCRPRGIDICLPAVVYRCLEYLEAKNAAGEEGIFRMSGSNNLIKHLRHKFNTEGDFDFLGEGEPYFDVHAIASLLKQYLRELPSMILTKELHMQFLSVLELKDDSQKVTAYNALVHRLPRPNFHLMRALSAYLNNVIINQDVNKMGVRNVCIVFSPTLNIPSPVLTMFLNAFDEIFDKEPDPEKAKELPSFEITSSSPDMLLPEDIRSPRKQMFSDLPTPSFSQASFGSSQPSPKSPRHNPVSGDLGFTPLQPAYDGPISLPYSQTQSLGSVTVAGPEYASVRPRELAPGQDVKARRRESSMLMLGPAQKKSSLPSLRSPDTGSSLVVDPKNE